ncbi:MAG: hypothetical protein LBG97_07425 [Coriobacteriales bacterium]|jgi:4-diphosphocytidyl-2-C-methyl-D-erythritol kinase|nr:hypothetical protein [Coriobacteriales bacterium]
MIITKNAYAKINLHLGVKTNIKGGRHQLDSVFATVGLHDVINFVFNGKTLQPKTKLQISIDMQAGDGISLPYVPLQKNIIYKAVRAFERMCVPEQEFKVDLASTASLVPANKLHISVTKNIPVQAGLGGGSTDAAATIMALADFCGMNSNLKVLQDVASSIGADVPFFLEGGCTLMGGAGDIIVRKLPMPNPSLQLLLVKPNKGVSTAAAYSLFDANPMPALAVRPLLDALRSNELLQCIKDGTIMLANNLTSAACQIVPIISDLLQELKATEGVAMPLLCGSGSTVFAICESEQKALTLASHYQKLGYWAFATTMT